MHGIPEVKTFKNKQFSNKLLLLSSAENLCFISPSWLTISWSPNIVTILSLYHKFSSSPSISLLEKISKYASGASYPLATFSIASGILLIPKAASNPVFFSVLIAKSIPPVISPIK